MKVKKIKKKKKTYNAYFLYILLIVTSITSMQALDNFSSKSNEDTNDIQEFSDSEPFSPKSAALSSTLPISVDIIGSYGYYSGDISDLDAGSSVLTCYNDPQYEYMRIFIVFSSLYIDRLAIKCNYIEIDSALIYPDYCISYVGYSTGYMMLNSSFESGTTIDIDSSSTLGSINFRFPANIVNFEYLYIDQIVSSLTIIEPQTSDIVQDTIDYSFEIISPLTITSVEYRLLPDPVYNPIDYSSWTVSSPILTGTIIIDDILVENCVLEISVEILNGFQYYTESVSIEQLFTPNYGNSVDDAFLYQNSVFNPLSTDLTNTYDEYPWNTHTSFTMDNELSQTGNQVPAIFFRFNEQYVSQIELIYLVQNYNDDIFIVLSYYDGFEEYNILSFTSEDPYSLIQVNITVDPTRGFHGFGLKNPGSLDTVLNIYHINLNFIHPTYSVLSISPGSTNLEGPPSILLEIVDTWDISSLQYQINGEGTIYDANIGSWSLVTPTVSVIIDSPAFYALTDGFHEIQFTCGNSQNISLLSESSITTFSVELNPPLLTILAPTPNFHYNSAPSYELSISDPNLNSANTQYTIGVETEVIGSTTIGFMSTTIWDGLTQGTHTIEFQVEDTYGHSTTKFVSIVKDTVLPTVSINSPADDTMYGMDAPEISFNMFDVNGFAESYYQINGIGKYNFSTGDASFQVDQSVWNGLGEGIYQISIVGIDPAGNQAVDIVSIIKDIEAPNLVVNAPNQNYIYDTIIAYDLTISDLLSDIQTAFYRVDDITTDYIITEITGLINAGLWTSLTEGIHNITFVVIDDANNMANQTIDFEKDTQSPSLSLNYPTSSTYYNEAPIISFDVSDVNLAHLYCSIGVATEVEVFSFENFTLNSEWGVQENGLVNIQLRAVDVLQHETIVNVEVYKDTEIPTLTSTIPIENSYISSQAFEFELTISESVSAMWFDINGEQFNVTQIDTFDQEIWDDLPEGIVTISIYFMDMAGNLGESTLLMYKDTIAPEVIVNSPIEGNHNEILLIDLTITELNTYSIYYSIDNMENLFVSANSNTTIDETLWNSIANNQEFNLTIVITDQAGNSVNVTIPIKKTFNSEEPGGGEKPPIPEEYILIGSFVVVVLIGIIATIIKKKFGG